MRHVFGQIERHTVFGDLRTGQVVFLALALGGTVLALITGQGIPHLLAAGAFAAAGAWVAFGRIRGLAPAEWANVLSGHGAQALSGRLRYESPAPGAGIVLPRRRGGRMVVPEALPPELGNLEMLEAPVPSGGVIGVIKDHRADTYTGAALARAPAFGLVGHEGQEHLQSDYADVLAISAREDRLIRRVGWVDATLPVYGDEIAAWFERNRDRGLSLSSPAMRSMIELTDTTLTVGQEHQVLVCLQFHGRRTRRAGRRLAAGEQGALMLVGQELNDFAVALDEAGVVVEGGLSPGLYRAAIRNAYDPFTRSSRAEEHDGQPWPVMTRTELGRYHSDGAVHATYWVSSLPRVPVHAAFLQPLLAETHMVRSVAVVMEPVAPSRAIREVETARARDESDALTRARYGQLDTARHSQQREASERREQELAAGHVDYRHAMFITASAPNAEELERACADLERAAGRCRLSLQRLYGQQQVAFSFTLPLCRGLR
jgi:hypothetical protein